MSKRVITVEDLVNVKEYETDPTVVLGYVDLTKYVGNEGTIVVPTKEGDLTYDLSTNNILAIDVLGGLYCPPNQKFFKGNNTSLEKTPEITQKIMGKVNSFEKSKSFFEKHRINPEDVKPYAKNYNRIKAQQIQLLQNEERAEGFIVTTKYGDMEGADKDFVVVDQDNQPGYTCAREVFEKTYRPFVPEKSKTDDEKTQEKLMGVQVVGLLNDTKKKEPEIKL